MPRSACVAFQTRSAKLNNKYNKNKNADAVSSQFIYWRTESLVVKTWTVYGDCFDAIAKTEMDGELAVMIKYDGVQERIYEGPFDSCRNQAKCLNLFQQERLLPLRQRLILGLCENEATLKSFFWFQVPLTSFRRL